MDKIIEEHIKYEAEESERLAEQLIESDHVWEEVVIDDSNEPGGWTEEVHTEVMEEDANAEENNFIKQESTDVTMESTMSESSETSAIGLNPVTGERIIQTETAAAVESIEDTTIVTQPMVTTTADTPSLPIISNVKSIAAKPMQKYVNLNNIKLLPKGSFLNLGNKKMQLVTLTKDKKWIPGKVVTVANNDNRIITGKLVSIGGPEGKLLPTKVVRIPGNNNMTTVNMGNNKVIPAKVVTIANPEVKSQPNNKEVTIYITGLAGDKVQIRDKLQVNRLQIGDRVQLGQREVETEGWRSDHIDACLPLPDESEVEIVNPDTEGAEGHFLLEGNQSFDTTNLTCNICDRQFTQLKYLLSHQQTHILAEPVHCDTCGKSFKRRYDLLRHKRRAHAETDTLYQCDVCQKTFTDRVVANKHRLTHTEDFKYCCEVCNRPFKFVHDLKRHRSIHYDEKPFDCEICGKKFKHKSNLKTHQATHYSEKPYSCTLCDKRFHQKGNLKTHLIVHTGEMPFVCNICTKRFHTRSGLLNHSYSHSDDKPFQCDICDKTFNWKSGLLTHQQTHRQRVIPEEVQVIEIGPIPVDN